MLPRCRILDERTEILTDGTLKALQPLDRLQPTSRFFCRHIVSGGQTGVDRAALDFAIANGYTHGGWAPSGRKAEDGRIAVRYQLVELSDGGYRQRTRRNVEDSDGTLIINLGALDGGTRATQQFAEILGQPSLVLLLDTSTPGEAARAVVRWLNDQAIGTFNVAGPRESKRPGIYGLTVELLAAIHVASRMIA